MVTARGAARGLAVMATMSLPIDLQLLACGEGTATARHSLAAHRPPHAPILQILATTRAYTRSEDFGVSYLNGTNAFSLIHFCAGVSEIPGWTRCDLGQHEFAKPLRLASESADFILGGPVIERLTARESEQFLVECRRILKAGAVLRISVSESRVRVAERLMTAPRFEKQDIRTADLAAMLKRLHYEVSEWPFGRSRYAAFEEAEDFLKGHAGAFSPDNLRVLEARKAGG